MHGKYSPDRPMGLGSNYPRDKDAYNEEVKKFMTTQPRKLTVEEQGRLAGDLKAWGQLREQRPPEVEELRRKIKNFSRNV